MSVIVELFRSLEYAQRDVSIGNNPTRRLKAAERLLYAIAPNECSMVSWATLKEGTPVR